MTYGALKQYKENTVFTASPEELTLMLYDGAIRFMNVARYNMREGRMEKAHGALIRAQDIVIELRSSLNTEYEISDNLGDLYEFLMDSLISANIDKDTQPIEEALEIVTEIRDTWKLAMQEVKKRVYRNRKV